MITGIALILIGVYVAMPKAIMITLIVFGSLNIVAGILNNVLEEYLKKVVKTNGAGETNGNENN